VIIGRANLIGLLVESLDEPFDGVRACPHAAKANGSSSIVQRAAGERGGVRRGCGLRAGVR
jgi:hypothetical protein